MKPLTSRLLVAAALLSIPAGLSAHRQWLLPSGTIFSGTDSWVTVDAAVSNDLFYADHVPGRLEPIRVWQPDGTPGRIQNGATGKYRSVFDVQLDKPGTWKIGSETVSMVGSYTLNGVEQRVGGRPMGGPQTGGGQAAPRPVSFSAADIPAGATDVKLTETISRNEIFVTTGEPTTAVFKTSGKGLELAPITHPDELVAGETARFRFLVDGQPAPGLKVTVVPGGKRYRDAEGATELTTGADGVLSVRWPAAGMYWLNATLTDQKVSSPKAMGRRLSYTTTVEVMTP